MTVGELKEKLFGALDDDEIVVNVHCPRGGNSLPTTFAKVVIGYDEVYFDLSPADGVEYEVFDAEEEEEEDDDDI